MKQEWWYLIHGYIFLMIGFIIYWSQVFHLLDLSHEFSSLIFWDIKHRFYFIFILDFLISLFLFSSGMAFYTILSEINELKRLKKFKWIVIGYAFYLAGLAGIIFKGFLFNELYLILHESGIHTYDFEIEILYLQSLLGFFIMTAGIIFFLSGSHGKDS